MPLRGEKNGDSPNSKLGRRNHCSTEQWLLRLVSSQMTGYLSPGKNVEENMPLFPKKAHLRANSVYRISPDCQLSNIVKKYVYI